MKTSNGVHRLRPYDQPETVKQHATLLRLLIAATYLRLATTGESATHETVYSKVSCQSTTLLLTIATIAGSSVANVFCNRHVLKYGARHTRKMFFSCDSQ